MSDRLLDKYLTRKPDDREGIHAELDQSSADSESAVDLGCFGWLRGVRDRAVMLELRKRDGTVAAFSYAYLERVHFDPSEGITLYVVGRQVRIRGRNLNGERQSHPRLFSGITRQRVPWVQESSKSEILDDRVNTIDITAIEW